MLIYYIIFHNISWMRTSKRIQQWVTVKECKQKLRAKIRGFDSKLKNREHVKMFCEFALQARLTSNKLNL